MIRDTLPVKMFGPFWSVWCKIALAEVGHTAGSDNIFVQIYMDPPPGAPGVSKDAPGSIKHAI